MGCREEGEQGRGRGGGEEGRGRERKEGGRVQTPKARRVLGEGPQEISLRRVFEFLSPALPMTRYHVMKRLSILILLLARVKRKNFEKIIPLAISLSLALALETPGL